MGTLDASGRVDWPWRGLGTAAVFCTALFVWLVLKPGNHALVVAVDNVAQFMGPMLMLPLCFAGNRRIGAAQLRAGQRWAPYFLGLGALSYALGQVIYTIYEQVLGFSSVPFPSWADAVYLWAYPCLLVGILLLPGRPLPLASRVRVALDGLMIMTAVITFSWYFILGPTIAQSGGTFLATTVGLAYPVGDLVLICCLLMLWSRLDDVGLRRAVTLLSCALAVIVITDTIYDYQTLHGGYSTGGLLDVGWPIGYMLVGLSGQTLWQGLRRAAQTGGTPSPTSVFVLPAHPTAPPALWSSLLPSALVPAVGALLLYTGVVEQHGRHDAGVVAGALILVMIVVVRQVLTILENRRLYVRLDEAYAAQGLTLARREQQMLTVVANAPIVLSAIDREGVCTLYDGYGLAKLGHTPGQFVGQSMFDVFQEQPRLVEAMRHALAGDPATLVVNEGDFVFECSWTPVRDAAGAFDGAIGVSHDITERTRAEEALQHRAFHDVLTGLPNRALFLDRLDHALARAHRHGGKVGVLFLDLDRFKYVNDSLGHAAGDLLLIAVAGRLQEAVRSEDTVARFGGDEFAILLGEMDDPTVAVRSAERIIQALDASFDLNGHSVVIATSIGIVTSTPAHAGTDMLRDADVALYRAKAKGRGRYEIFDATMNAQAIERLELEADLRSALQLGEFIVYYQPKFALASGRLSGMEALVRWQHPRRGLVSPDAFIPMAEETGLIRPLGQWVLEEACRQTKAWHDETPDLDLVTSVNLSPRQFQQPTLVDDVAAALTMSGVDPSCIQLEITESAAMEDAEVAVGTLHQLKALGVKLAIDDFGTGYSSLAYLKRFPVDELKIDRAFVTGLGQGSEDASIINAVTSLGHALNLSIVAEGIETAEELHNVHALGCEIGQGYYFAKPLSAEEADAFMARKDERAA